MLQHALRLLSGNIAQLEKKAGQVLPQAPCWQLLPTCKLRHSLDARHLVGRHIQLAQLWRQQGRQRCQGADFVVGQLQQAQRGESVQVGDLREKRGRPACLVGG